MIIMNLLQRFPPNLLSQVLEKEQDNQINPLVLQFSFNQQIFFECLLVITYHSRLRLPCKPVEPIALATISLSGGYIIPLILLY